MGKRRRITAPLWKGALPPPPVQPSATVAGYSTLQSSAEMERQNTLADLQRASSRAVIWSFPSALIGDPALFADALVSTNGPALVRAGEITGLTNDGLSGDSYSIALATVPAESFGDLASPQLAQLAGGIPARGMYAVIPFGGEWIVRMRLDGNHAPIIVRGQVYDNVAPRLLTTYPGGIAETRSEEHFVTDLLPFWRFGDAANLRRITLAQRFSTLAGGQPVQILIGGQQTPWNMLSAGLNVNNAKMTFDLWGQSCVVQYTGGGALQSCAISALMEFE